MGRPKKDEFADLDDDFKDAAHGMDEATIRARISEVALNQAALMEAKDGDEDLKTKKEVAKDAGAVYRDGTKANKLRVKFYRRVLGDKLKPNGDSGLE